MGPYPLHLPHSLQVALTFLRKAEIFSTKRSQEVLDWEVQ